MLFYLSGKPQRKMIINKIRIKTRFVGMLIEPGDFLSVKLATSS